MQVNIKIKEQEKSLQDQIWNPYRIQKKYKKPISKSTIKRDGQEGTWEPIGNGENDLGDL